MFIVFVYKDCDVYEYRYDNLEEAEACASTSDQSEIIYPQEVAGV